MKNYKTIIISLSIALTGTPALAQHSDKSNKKLFKQAEKAFGRADYLKALPLYRENFSKDSNNIQAFYKAGLCLVGVNKTDSTAIPYFKKSLTKIPEAHFYLGKIYHMKNQSESALMEFQEFKKLNKETEITNKEADNWVKKCEQSILQSKQKEVYVVSNLGPQINTSFPEYVPLIWEKDGSLIFTSRRKGGKSEITDPYGKYYEDIFISHKTNSGWSAPVLLSDSLNTDGHDACVAFSTDADELIIYRTDENKTGGDLYISKYKNGAWAKPVKLGKEINSEDLETSACFSADGSEIIFSSNRPGGKGGRDLYRVVRFPNGKYSLPLNLGSEINTEEDEDGPFLDKNDNSLYFSSRGHNSMGEYDIFKATYNYTTKKWTDPENLGQPINSTNDDIYFVRQYDKDIAYFTSRREGGFGDADIYEVNFSESTKQIVYCNLTCNGQKKDEMKNWTISLRNIKTNEIEGKYRPNIDYFNTILFVEKNTSYELIIEGEDINTIKQQYIFTDATKEITIDLTAKP